MVELNEQQLEAVQHGTGAQSQDRRALLIVAGAGSGKTQTLAHRVARLILDGADPQRLLLLTFSRRAAQEMQRRAGSVLQLALAKSSLGLAASAAPNLPWAGTFHSVGARLLRDYAGRIGLDESFSIHDRGDAEDLMGLVRHEQGLSASKTRFPLKSTCLSIYSRVVNTREPLADVLDKVFPWCARWEAELKLLFKGYLQAKQAQNQLDYDDLLLFWAEMMCEPSLASDIGARFDHVLVDEYQDTNRLQAAILLALKPDGAGVTVVGDDAQSIYSFRGATVRNMLDFPSQVAQRDGTSTVRLTVLDRNYRSTQPILDASNAVIEAAKERFSKRLWTDRISSQRPQLVLVQDEAEQARWVADKVLQQRENGYRLKAQAALFRTSSHSAALELELARRSIPFVKFGGLKFLEAAHIKDLLAILRFAQNPRSRLAGFRVLQLIPGIGPATASGVLDAMAQASDPGATLLALTPPPQAAQDWSAFKNLYAALRQPSLPWPTDLELANAWYRPHLERLHEDAPVRRIDIEQLLRLASDYGSRQNFLTELTLDPPEATSDHSGPAHLDEDYMTLSTIHSAKGQEWKSVSILNVVDGCIPSDLATGNAADIEEELRLLYVGMTRARDSLHLLVPQRFYVTQQAPGGSRHIYAGRSRFIPEAVMHCFEQVNGGAPDAAAAQQLSGTGSPLLQIRERAGSTWD